MVDESPWAAGWMPSFGKEPCRGHWRKGVYHAELTRDHYLVHRDKVDPAKDLWGHLVEDAPDIVAWGRVLLVIGVVDLPLAYALSKG